MSLTPDTNPEPKMDPALEAHEQGGSNPQRSFRILGALLAIALGIGIGEGLYAWWLSSRLQDVERTFQAQISRQDETIHRLRDRMGMTEEQFTGLQGELVSTKDNLGKTQSDLRRTRVLSDQLAKQQKESADVLNSQLGQLQQEQATTKGAVGTLSTDVTGVKQEVGVTKQELATTRSELQRMMGDLGVQSGLIARNRDELGELRLLGERDYYEFDLRKTKQPQRFGAVGLQLKKTDVKRQKYTLDLIADDRRIEKKDKNTNEPVQFYQQGNRQPAEIVVNQIYKDRVVGYVSMPKQRQTRLSSTGIGNSGS